MLLRPYRLILTAGCYVQFTTEEEHLEDAHAHFDLWVFHHVPVIFIPSHPFIIKVIDFIEVSLAAVGVAALAYPTK